MIGSRLQLVKAIRDELSARNLGGDWRDAMAAADVAWPLIEGREQPTTTATIRVGNRVIVITGVDIKVEVN